MPKFSCHCDVCGIDFISHKTQRTICNKCSTNGEETKEIICKKCGKLFNVGRNPNDENNFYKKVICPECSGYHCKKCGKPIDHPTSDNICDDCKKHTCSKCGIEIEVENIPGTNKYLPKNKKRKLCDKCYEEFLKETKEITCKNCNKTFTVGRSKVDGGFLLKDFCPECYNNKFKPEYKIKTCYRCGNQFKIYPNSDNKFTEKRKYCPDCLPIALKEEHNKTCKEKYGVDYSCLLPQCRSSKSIKTSKLNDKFAEFLNNNGIKTELEWYDETNYRHYDIFLPEQDILIEINPTYTHNIYGSHFDGFEHKNENKFKWLHYYRSKDIDKHVIHVWDWDDWDKVLHLISKKNVKYARKLKIQEISDKQKLKDFLELNHIQGNCRNKSVNLGLYDDNELIQVIVFGKPRYNKNYQWELLRLCSKFDCVVVGGAEKLFKHFILQYAPESIISYCDISKFTGSIYTKLGFKLTKITAPNKIWSKNTSHITDNLLRQRGYDQLFKTNYGKGTSNEQLMLDNGWLPIYDCGQKVFEYRKEEI